MCAAPYPGSSIQYDVMTAPDVLVPMRDGVRLATAVYYPSLPSIWPMASYPNWHTMYA